LRLDAALTLAEAAALAGAQVPGEDTPGTQGADTVHGLATLASAGADELSFLADPRYAEQARGTRARAVIARAADAVLLPPGCRLLSADDPYAAFARLARALAARQQAGTPPGIHPSASIADDAQIGADVSVGAHVWIGPGVRIGAGAVIGPGSTVAAGAALGAGTRLVARVTVYERCTLGERCLVHAGAVIGADGFGFAPVAGRWEKIPQLGAVRIGDDVEIGANTTIDRGALDDTVIGDGCKLDNQIQIGHNVRIGEHSALAGCVGVAGSAVIGRRCRIGGSAGILGHLEICDDVTISAMSLVTRSIRKPGFYSGVFPLMDNADWERAAATLRRLPDLRARLRRLERTDDEDFPR